MRPNYSRKRLGLGMGLGMAMAMATAMGRVMATGMGKSLFDYHSEYVRNHQDDWKPLLRWLKKLA
mgnify:CR=1 FL=1